MRRASGSRAGLKIWSSQEGVGSSLTFGTKDLRRIAAGAILESSAILLHPVG